MKNTKTLITGIALTACLTLQNNAEAQLLIPPANPDIAWYNACTPGIGVYIAGLNTAMIDCPGYPLQGIGPSTLIVSDYYGNGTAGGVSFRDIVTGVTQTIQYCGGPNYFGTSPDIIVGNDVANPLTDYRVAAAYVDAFTGQPTIDYYLVSYIATGVFGPPVLIAQTTFPGFKATTVHLDVMAHFGMTGVTGLPWCDRFIVTWDDVLTGKSYARPARLNAPPGAIGLGFPTITLNSGTGGQVAQPDVAAIRRLVPPCATCAPTNDRVGLFVTVENGNQLFYQEYDWSIPGFLTPPIPLGVVYPGGVMWPRIDAPDDFNINNPLTPGLCYYKVAAQISPGPGVYQSWVFDNMVPGGQNDAWYMPFTTGMYSPTVAYGGNGGTEYQILHYADAFTGPGPAPNVYMEPINWMFPASTTIPDAFIPWQPYFLVNMAPPTFANGNYMNSISTSVNNPAGLTLCAWADNNVFGGPPTATVYYKTTPYGGPNGYTFKHSKEEPVLAPAEKWKIYPNPAISSITVENNEQATYEITDMAGRKVLEGELIAGKQVIDISGLASGSYIITSFTEGVKKDHSNFVKQ